MLLVRYIFPLQFVVASVRSAIFLDKRVVGVFLQFCHGRLWKIVTRLPLSDNTATKFLMPLTVLFGFHRKLFTDLIIASHLTPSHPNLNIFRKQITNPFKAH